MTRRGDRSGSGARPRYRAFISYSHALDGRLAPALQKGLQRFARPWYRPWAMRVFRDQTGLSASPGLWSSIAAALAQSECFILLASPAAADSPWVGREVEEWFGQHGAAEVLIALTEGELAWDASARDFDPARSTALPPAMRGRFDEEPRFIDLRWARTADDLSLRNPRFSDCVADLAAPLHGRAKDELFGEEVRQRRRTRRVLYLTIVALIALLTGAIVAGLIAWDQRGKAVDQRQVALARQLSAEAELAWASEPGGVATSALLAVESLRVRPSQAAGRTLQRALSRLPLPGPSVLHDGAVNDVEFSPDGRSVLSCSDDGTARVWDSASGRTIATIRPGGEVRDADFSPDGTFVATAGSAREVALWSAADGRLVTRMPTDTGTASVTFSPDGRYLGAACDSSEGPDEGLDESVLDAYVWDLRRDTLVFRIPEAFWDELVWSPDGRFIAFSTGSGEKVWSMESGGVVAELGRFSIRTSSGGASFNAEGTMLYVMLEGDDGNASLCAWDTRDWSLAWSEPLGAMPLSGRLSTSTGYYALCFADSLQIMNTSEPGVSLGDKVVISDPGLKAFAFSPNDAYVATTGWDGTARVWHILSGAEIFRIPLEGIGEAIAFSPDGTRLVTGERTVDPTGDAASGRSQAATWELAEAAGDLESLDAVGVGGAYRVVVTPGAQVELEVSEGTTSLELVDASGGATVLLSEAIPPLSGSEPGFLATVVFSSTGRLVATRRGGGYDSSETARVWDTQSGRLLAEVEHPAMTCLCFSGDHQLVTGGHDTSPRVWSLPSGVQTAVLPTSGGVEAVVSAGEYIVTQSGEVTVWSTEGESLSALQLRDGEYSPSALALTKDGRHLAVGLWNGDVEIWELPRRRIAVIRLEIGREFIEMGLNRQPTVRSLAFTPDHLHLGIGYDDRVRVWDVGAGMRAFDFPSDGSWGIGSDLSFSPDGSHLVVLLQTSTASSEGARYAGLVDLGSGELGLVVREDRPIRDARYVADDTVVVEYDDGSQAIQRWVPYDLMAEAAVRLTRNLSQAEWSRYVGDSPYRVTIPGLPIPEE